ncbi:hypothetical protein T265_07951 [Opisthorchis viverrini]|uniref:Uncharacterized protein n=1 Tax=Opisthorchis viverrini TaxID=6198 RepID=A0A074ZB48_OPIVI|nr:hypothetical protein T265_07951 [Opisthorchis viverrini]KER24348.1 hypothetical protein T265_07951 [Opisthorchis viverrini]
MPSRIEGPQGLKRDSLKVCFGQRRFPTSLNRIYTNISWVPDRRSIVWRRFGFTGVFVGGQACAVTPSFIKWPSAVDPVQDTEGLTAISKWTDEDIFYNDVGIATVKA